MKRTIMYVVALFSNFLILNENAIGQHTIATDTAIIQWGEIVPLKSTTAVSPPTNRPYNKINALNEVTDTGYGSQYCRLLNISGNQWLAVYTVQTNKGYKKDPQGGLRLEIASSKDNGQTWRTISRLKDPGRDLDNGQLIRLNNGYILLACRSVRWHTSYLLPVYESRDEGKSWKRLSIIDRNEGPDGSLGHPDKGIYEPHMILLKTGQLAVFYANEKHVTETPSYSQIISEKVSTDQGKTWGPEIFVAHDPNNKDARPGMPVCTEMQNGNYMVVYELCGTKGCNIYQKSSPNAIDWPVGVGKAITNQTGAPFILSLTDGRLVVSSNRGNVSLSNDYGDTWQLLRKPWHFTKPYEKDWQQALWPSIYQFGPDRIGVTAGLRKKSPHHGHQVTIRFGTLKKIPFNSSHEGANSN